MIEPKYEVNILPQYEKACGLDIHKDIIIIFISNKSGDRQLIKEFGTNTEDLRQIVKCLHQEQVVHSLMESTGVYWISLYHMLMEAGISVVVANPMHIKQIPKRKTDKKDARWLCMLLLNGLVRPSLIPNAIEHELREYCRSRLHYTHQRSRSLNRIVRILERANIKIRSVVSNIRVKSSMDIIRLFAAGETDIEKFIDCCKGKLKKKIPQMRKALQGILTAADRNMLTLLLGDIDHIDRNLTVIEQNIEQVVTQHFEEATDLLKSISGIGKQSAQDIISEIIDNMEKFPSADHLTFWTGLAPGNHESAGKRKSVSTKKGNKYLRTVMVAVAWGAIRTRDSYWRCLYEHLKKRMKPQKAIIVIARRLLKVIYKTLKEKTPYNEGGTELFYKVQLVNRMRNMSRLMEKQKQLSKQI